MDSQTIIDTLEAQSEALIVKDEYIKELETEIDNRIQADEIRRNEGKKRGARKAKSAYFTKVYIYALHELIKRKVLASNEQALLFKFLPCVEYETNFIIDPITKQRMKIKDIAKLAGLNERTIIRVLNSLEDKQIITRHGEGQSTYIELSDTYFYRGEE